MCELNLVVHVCNLNTGVVRGGTQEFKASLVAGGQPGLQEVLFENKNKEKKKNIVEMPV